MYLNTFVEYLEGKKFHVDVASDQNAYICKGRLGRTKVNLTIKKGTTGDERHYLYITNKGEQSGVAYFIEHEFIEVASSVFTYMFTVYRRFDWKDTLYNILCYRYNYSSTLITEVQYLVGNCVDGFNHPFVVGDLESIPKYGTLLGYRIGGIEHTPHGNDFWYADVSKEIAGDLLTVFLIRSRYSLIPMQKVNGHYIAIGDTDIKEISSTKSLRTLIKQCY